MNYEPVKVLNVRCKICGELIVLHDPDELPLIEATQKCLICRIRYLDLLRKLRQSPSLN